MSGWFLDASVILASEDRDDHQHEAARRLLRGHRSIAVLDLTLYEVMNVAVRSWRDEVLAGRLRQRLTAIADDGGVLGVNDAIIGSAATLAQSESISVYDAAYVIGAERRGMHLVSCDVRDLVSRGLAILPNAAVDEDTQDQ